MAPELISGAAVDGRADLYALGCVGYYLLTGTLVFRGETPVQLIVQHLQSEPEPPSVRLGAPVPAGLEKLILRCLAKDPNARPASARELDSELQAAGAGEWSPEVARAWWDASQLTTEAAAGPVRQSPTTPRELETTVASDRPRLSEQLQ
jgi:serine/threonine-protein kinase